MAIEEPCCIVSIDKDLLQIPGMHFNFVKGLLYEIDEQEALKCFYRSILTGDLQVDNIPGINGLGPVKSGKLINHLTNALDMYKVCVEAYTKEYKESALDLLHRNAQLLHIRTKEGIGWTPPK